MAEGRIGRDALVSVKIYVEGGRDGKDLRTKCRKGFRNFLEKCDLKGSMPRISACGPRREAYDDFCTALQTATNETFFVLLVDSERPIVPNTAVWEHLKSREGDR